MHGSLRSPPMTRPLLLLSLALGASVLLAGCEQLGIESPEKVAAARDADGKAVGGACRHAMRAIEDCYNMNKKADRAAIFAGWREMNDYMRENKLDGVAPSESTQVAAAKPAAEGDAAAAPDDEKKPAGKSSKADKPEKTAKGDKAEKPEKADKADKADKAAMADKPDAADKPEKTAKVH